MPGCTSPPRDPDNLCSIFGQKHAWYRTTLASQRRWGIDQATQMAVIFQESSFRAGARPPRTKLLGFIPWRRKSSAYGYAQVVDGTWDVYRREAVRPRAERNRFADATDFIGWYMSRIAKRAQIDKTSARSLYLAYHEGAGGFQRGTHLKKKWLLDISYRVAQRTARYRAQLELCRERLERYRWWWPF
ncbi:MAG: transglycosylase SLT domain-containing protein [Myxococcales bacterium]|nr:transglycosylase SLT domain-containing protein [Myxococcales bacterium]